MPDRSKKRPRDPNQLAYQIMLESTGQVPKYDPYDPYVKDESGKNPAAVALGRLGGLKDCEVCGQGIRPTPFQER